MHIMVTQPPIKCVNRILTKSLVILIIVGLLSTTIPLDIVQGVLPGPTLISPIDKSVVTTSQPTFEWSSVSGAVEYNIQADTDTAFDPAIGSDYTSSTSYTPPPQMALPDDRYYWRVRAKDSSGTWGSWSVVWRFNVDTMPPAKPILASPINGAGFSTTTVTFNWNDVTDAYYYHLQVDDTSDQCPSPLISLNTLTASEYTANSLPEDSTIYWRVCARDIDGNWGVWSNVWWFEIDLTSPTAPTLFSPISGTYIGSTVTFQWNSVLDAVEYRFQTDTDSLFGTPVNHYTADLSYSTSFPSTSHTRYYWRVAAKDNVGYWSSWSSVWYINYDTVPPESPTLLDPPNGVTIFQSLPVLLWDRPSDASSRSRVQVSNSSSFSTTIHNQEVVSSSYMCLNLADGLTYYWRVKAKDHAGNWGPFSTPRSFTKNSAGPNLIEPDNGMITTNHTIFFDWEVKPTATDYCVKIDTLDWFPSPDLYYTGVNTYHLLTNLPDGTYFWQVRAKDSEGNWSDNSELRSFTVVKTLVELPMFFALPLLAGLLAIFALYRRE